MEIGFSRRRFLQGSVALSILGGANLSGSEILALSRKANSDKPDSYTVPTLCEMCVNKCAAIAHVENGIVKNLTPNPLLPKSRNMLCARGVAGIHALYDPDRLKSPLIRTGKRGDGKYVKATWDEAFEYIKTKLVKIVDEEQDNRSTISYCAGEGLAEHTFKSFMADKFGSSNFLNHSTICLQTAVSGYALTIGEPGLADLENAKYIIMAGANRAEAILTPDTMDLFKRTRGKGAKLIAIDPRYTNTAMHADLHIAIKPGTDLAFVLALTYVALSEKIYNTAFVENNFNDFDKYENHILSNNYTPEWAEKITGVAAKTIYQVARDFMAAAPQAIYYRGRRSTWGKNDFQLRRAMALFSALGGGVDVKGGIVFGKKLPLGEHEINAPLYFNAESRIESDAAAIIGASGSWVAWRNMVADNKEPYPIRGMFVYKQNPMMSVPDSSRTRKMLEKLDLLVVIDTMPSDTAMFADVILPECSYLEREDPLKSFAGIEPAIGLRRKVIEPMYDSKPVIEIMRGLSQKLSKPLWEITKKYDEDVIEALAEEDEAEYYRENGFDLSEPYLHSQEHINHHRFVEEYGEQAWLLLRDKGIYYPEMEESFTKLNNNTYQCYAPPQKTYSTLKRTSLAVHPSSDPFYQNIAQEDVPEVGSWQRSFKTPSKKIECHLTNLATKGVDAMPTWHQDDYVTVPEGKFKFITGRHAQHTQSSSQNNVMLLDIMPENYVWINDVQAQKLGIGHGDVVEITSSVGKTRIKAYPTPKIIGETLFYIHGFGAQSTGQTFAHRNGASDNQIIEGIIEPVFGSAIMHDTLVTVKRV